MEDRLVLRQLFNAPPIDPNLADVLFRTERQSMLTARRALSASIATVVVLPRLPADYDHLEGNSRGRNKALLRLLRVRSNP